ncbi:RapZ C-terminal domain-containing protein [Dietzia maris]|uniref:RapZ C-terminal domain-containing protein n=1 Tax=Dietzia maris TaxID=37915 RepID=UPI0037CA0D31
MLVSVSSFSYDTGPTPQADLVVDCRGLPNPYQVPGLRPRDGTQAPVRDWLMSQPATPRLIDDVLTELRHIEATSVAVGCSAGRHRSVVVADQLAARLGTTAQHVALDNRAARRAVRKRNDTTTGRGLGWKHQKQRESLLRTHQDGTPCWWCARPMYRTAAKNFDDRPLAADHSEARSIGGDKADRLLHSTCNEQRQDGARDHLRPALTGVWPPPAGAVVAPKVELTGPPEPRAHVLTWG